MAMASSTDETQKLGYPSPDKTLAAAPGRVLRHDRNPSFAFGVPSYPNQPLPNSPNMYGNSLLREQRRRHFRHNFPTITTTTTTKTTSSHDKIRTCLIIAMIFFSILALVGVPIIMFYVFGPHSPTFSIEQVTLYSPNGLTSLFNITLKVNNPSRHIGIFYEDHNSIVASYSGIRLSSGGFPGFFQPPKEETRLMAPMAGLGVFLPDDVNQKLQNDIRNQRVPLALNVMGMVRFMMGSLKPKAVLKVSCEMVLDNLMSNNPKLVSSSCDSTAGFWFLVISN
ncbi:hypothetical protein PTKIN_Ptkin04bG0023400 [Pterospermum kingtungense]